jgi:hypothetical protein
MKQFGCSDWTEHELAVMKEKWLGGWTDEQIARHLQTRSAKAIQGKRRDLKLIVSFHPERPQSRSITVRYSHEDEIDILHRFHAKEPLASIAARYHVSEHAIISKIRRLGDGLTPIPPRKTERRCLGCGNKFVSALPKSVNRRCQTCYTTLIAGGASFLTAY